MKRTAAATTVDRLEAAFRALSDTTRLRILALLGNNEVCVCHLHDTLGVPQPTVSRHLAFLRRSGLVEARRDGLWMHYRVSSSLDPGVRQVIDAVIAAISSAPTTIKDRKQFERAFGDLYVLPAPGGGCCCAPRTS